MAGVRLQAQAQGAVGVGVVVQHGWEVVSKGQPMFAQLKTYVNVISQLRWADCGMVVWWSVMLWPCEVLFWPVAAKFRPPS